jgi:hypothetical protein
MSANESTGQGILAKYLASDISPTTQNSLDTYNAILKGANPTDVYNNYMEYTAPLENAYLRNTTIPTLKESMVQGGTLRSSGTETALQKAISDFGNNQLSRIGTTVNERYNTAANALGQASTMNELSLNSPNAKVTAASTYGALPRLLEQADLNAKYEEFKRTNPNLSSTVDQILQALGIQTQSGYITGGDKGILGGLIGGLVGKYVGGSGATNSVQTDYGQPSSGGSSGGSGTSAALSNYNSPMYKYF